MKAPERIRYQISVVAVSLPAPSNQEPARACLSLSPMEFLSVDYESDVEKKKRESDMKTNTSDSLPFLK